MGKLPLRGFPSAHIASGIVQYALRKSFREYVDIGKVDFIKNLNE
ncbi:MAG: hypothetical protein PVSMB11_10750 [Desulfuromonadaceae bacterium]